LEGVACEYEQEQIKALKILSKCQVNWLQFDGTNRSKIKITKLSEKQRAILKTLGCENVIDRKKVHELLEKVECRL